MKKYQQKFIQLNMISIISILLIVMISILIYMYKSYNDSLYNTMKQVVEPYDSLINNKDNKPEPNQNNQDNDIDDKDITTIFFTNTYPISNIQVLSRNNIVADQDISEVIDQIFMQEKQYGILTSLNLIFYIEYSNNDQYKVALTSTDYIFKPIINSFLLMLLIFIIAIIIFYFISKKLSQYAIKPLQIAIQREKQFVIDASHDLKTPLSIILANNSILYENKDDTISNQIKWIDSNQNAAKSMQTLVNSMLTLSSVENDSKSIEFNKVNISDLTYKSSLQLESLAYEKNITLNTDIQEDIIINSNQDYLSRLITSLIDNAIKYEKDNGSINVTLKQTKHSVILTINNKTTTINNKDLPHIFERFYKADCSRSNNKNSYGLGLAIVKEIVDTLHGKIDVISNENIGTSFIVTFKNK